MAIAFPGDLPQADEAETEKETSEGASLPERIEEQQATLDSVIALAQTCGYEAEHTHHVTFLAERMFDDLRELHKLGDNERFLLTCASLLHDIGWMEGQRGHHKTTLRIILETTMLPFNYKERLIIGSIARYHRGSLPKHKHDHYAALEPEERHLVDTLAAILRVADGLDRTHRGLVQDIHCTFSHKKIVVHCSLAAPFPDEEAAAKAKSDLLEKVFDRMLVLKWKANHE